MNSNSISLDFVDHHHKCQLFYFENDTCDTCLVQDSIFEDLCLVQDSIFEDLMSCSCSKFDVPQSSKRFGKVC